MKTKTISLLHTLFLFTTFVQGQTIPVRISLDQAIEQSLQKNELVKAETFHIDYQKQLKRTSTEIPKATVEMMYGQYNSVQKHDNNFSINQTIPFPTVFTRQAALGSANVKAAEFKKAVTENELLYNVKQVYYQLAYLKAHETFLRKQDSIFNKVVSIANARYKAGDGTWLEKISAETHSHKMRSMVDLNIADQRIAERQLQALLFSEQPVTVSEQNLPERVFTVSLSDSAMAITNPSIALYEQQIEVAQRKKLVESAKALPDFMIGYFNQTLIGTQNVNGQEVYFGSAKRFQGLYVGISIPIWFAPYAARTRALQYKAQVETANYTALKTRLISEAEQAMQQFYKYKNSLLYFKTSANANADVIEKQSGLAYQNGEIKYNDHLSNILQALTIRQDYLQALNQYNQSIVYLEYLIGMK